MKAIATLFLVAVLAYLLLWPVPIDPIRWQAQDSMGYVGDFAVNTKLQQFTAMSMAGGLSGPESMAVDAQGNLYSGTHEGWIVRWLVNQQVGEKWVNVSGRPLGLAFDAQGNLWVANAYRGLQKITPSKELSLELFEVDGLALSFPDDLIIKGSKVYFSDATTKFAARDWGGILPASFLDILEHRRNGRIIEYDVVTKSTRSLMSNLSFANGVAIAPNGDFLLVVESGEYRVWRHWLKGQNAGNSDIIIDNLPGFPDNIHIGQNGRYWLGLTAPRNDLVDSLADKPWLRKVIQRFPEFIQPKVEHYGMVVAIDGSGQVLENAQAPNGSVYATTGALETEQYLYVSSLTAPFIARYPKSVLALQ